MNGRVEPGISRQGWCVVRGAAPVALALWLAGCGGEQVPVGDVAVEDSAKTDSTASEGRWVDLVSRGSAASSVLPVTFRSTREELRVVTRMGESISPYSQGRVVSNILSDRSSLPLASVRAEQPRLDTITSDTTEVTVEPGELQLYIAEQRGLQEWRVTVQEKRP